MQTQETTAKDFSYSEKPKTEDLKSVLPYDNTAEPAKKENKQKRFKRQQECIKEPKETSAIGNNTIITNKKKKKRDTSKITYFSYDKKDHYISKYTKLKNQHQSWQPLYW